MLCPAQSVEVDADTTNVGVLATATVTVLMALVQTPLEPVMLYTVVAAGLSVLDAPDPDGDQV